MIYLGLSFCAGADYTNVQEFVSKGIMMFADTSRRAKPFAKDPAVVKFNDNYYLYYSIPPNDSVKGWRIAVAKSIDLLVWSKIGELQPAQEVEKNGFCAPGAIVLNDKIHLFYQTYGNGRNDAICHAISEDRINFVRNPDNPVFRPSGSWNCGRAIDADVIMHNTELLLYFATRDITYKTQMVGVASAPINSDFSKKHWKLMTNAPVLKPELAWEKMCIEAPAVCKVNGNFYMFYAGGYNNEPQQIGCAISSDGITYKRLSHKPIVPSGSPSDWNSSESGHPFVFRDADKTYLFFQGNNDNGKSWFLSKVAITWKDGIPIPEIWWK